MASRISAPAGLDADTWVSTGVWANVISSNVAAIRYDDVEGVLYVAFGKGVWAYDGIVSSLAKEFFNSESLGRFLHRNIKPFFAARRVE